MAHRTLYKETPRYHTYKVTIRDIPTGKLEVYHLQAKSKNDAHYKVYASKGILTPRQNMEIKIQKV